MSPLWVEGQVVQLTRRPGHAHRLPHPARPRRRHVASVTIHANALDAMAAPLAEGARVVRAGQAGVLDPARHAACSTPAQIRPVGVGELLARLEHLKRTLAAEGLFDARPQAAAAVPAADGRAGLRPGQRRRAGRRRERPAPLAGGAVRRSAQVAVQGPDAVTRSAPRCTSSDARPDGRRHRHRPRRRLASRTCCRSATRPWCARSRPRAPRWSAPIGHDVDTPLLDLVADVARLHPDRRGQARGARRSAERGTASAPPATGCDRARRHARSPASAGT